MRFLCVSDIHGHAAALKAVIREAEALGFDQLIACGDLCFPGPEPLEVWKILVQHRALCTQGVGDRALAAIDPEKLSATGEAERARIERLRKAHRELGDIIVARLGQLPPIARLPIESGHTLLVVHGSPADPTEPFDINVCGGSHVAFDRTVADVRIVNVGSVGEAPSGDHAAAAIITTSQLGISVEQLAVPLPPAS